MDETAVYWAFECLLLPYSMRVRLWSLMVYIAEPLCKHLLTSPKFLGSMALQPLSAEHPTISSLSDAE